MTRLLDLNPLKSIAVPGVGSLEPRGLVVVIGPNSSGKTQFLKDIQGRILGQPRKLVVCEDVAIQRPPELTPFLDVLYDEKFIRRRTDSNGNTYIDCILPHLGGANQSSWSIPDHHVKVLFSQSARTDRINVQHVDPDGFLEHFGRAFLSSLFLDRRLSLTSTVEGFDYETKSPSNELQLLYVNSTAQKSLLTEAVKVFEKSIWVDATRANRLCLRVVDGSQLPDAEDRLQPEKVRQHRFIEDEGDGFRSYMGICMTLLLGQRPVCLIDEPEMCLHPPQAHALGRFIGKYGTSRDRVTFVSTHSSHVLRGIIEETQEHDIIRLSRVNARFGGKRVSRERVQACIDKPSTKIETVLDGLFAEAVTIVESEGDRLVYGTTWERIASEFHHDVHFVSVGGIGGIADTCRLYRNLSIPVCVIADLDLVHTIGTFEAVVRSLTGDDEARNLLVSCRELIGGIAKLVPLCTGEEVQRRLRDICDHELSWSDKKQVQRVRKTLLDLGAELSETAMLKKGADGLLLEPLRYQLSAFLGECRRFGLFLVPCGELENWLPELMAGGPSKYRKPEWANAAAITIRKSPVEDRDIWGFVRQMARYQRDEASRLSGYPLV